jgi:replicative DNA helicase
MQSIEHKWFSVIRNNRDLIEDSQIFHQENIFTDRVFNDLVRLFRNNIKTKNHLRTALNEAYKKLSTIHPQNTLRQEISAVYGLEKDVKSYEEEIFSRYAKIQLSDIGNSLANAPIRADDYQHILDDAKTRLNHIEESMSADTEMTKEKSFEIMRQKIEDMNNPNPALFIKSGIKKIDEKIIGFQKKKHIVIASRPSIGKTAGGLTLAINAKNQGKKVAFVSVEMTNDQIFSRACFNNGDIPSDVFNPGGNPQVNDFENLKKSAQELIADDNFILINPVRRNLRDVARSIRKCKRENPDLSMVVVDYLQKIQGTDKRANPVEQIKEISGCLTDLCKSLDVVMVTLAQLNRGADEGGIPQQSHLKGASDIEQDADMIFLLHRDRQAQKEAQATGTTRRPVTKGIDAEDQTIRGLQSLWILDKNRDGQTGMFKVYYDAPVMRFNSEVNGFVEPNFDNDEQF